MKINYFIHKYRRLFTIVVHFILVIIAYVGAFYLRFDFRLRSEYFPIILKTLPLLIIIKMAIFYYYGLFSGLWRYASIDDLWRIIKANFFSTAVFILGVVFIYNIVGYPRSIFFLDGILCIAFIGGLRFVTRLFIEIFKPVSAKINKRVIIVGAGEAGVMVLRECRNNPAMNMEIVGFIDDNPTKKNLRIQGIKILGTKHDIPAIVNKYGVEEIILAIPSAKGKIIREIISHCQIPNVKLKIVPGLQKILSGDLEVRPRGVKPEDLLGRETVEIDAQEISHYIRNKRILVTGAGGSIGSALCQQIALFSPKELMFYDHNENNVYFLEVEFKTKYPQVKFTTIIGDIKDIGLLKHTFSRYKPHVIFHSAAHKHVPLMEENPAAAVKNNIIGTRNLIYAANHYGVERFVLISTDKAVNPKSIMGATKRISEMILQAKAKDSKTRFMAVRFGNVLGSDGSVIPLFKKQIEERGPVTVTHPEAKRYFMSASEAAQLVLQAGAIGKKGEIFILDMGEQIKILDLARNLITLSGLKLDKDIFIKFIGLRPGEKLYEETLHDVEKDKTTKYEKIYIAQANEFESRILRNQVKELERLAHMMDTKRILNKIHEIVPSYVPDQENKN
ncbi:MAG TPA: nucleoside-diphosphate sugar epimerase/dehydratase [bacterium]|nr:nucleoside-diphosphate sugar epimerase/dehydratase [bacterium]